MQVVWTCLPDMKNQQKKRIFEILDYKIYDHVVIIQNKEEFEAWNGYAVGKNELDWKRFTEGYEAMIQASGEHTLEEIITVFPDIKVILEKLENETYYNRLNKFLRYLRLFRWGKIFPSINRSFMLIDKYLYKHFKMDFSQKNIEKSYRDYFNEVVRIVPRNQLLIVDEKSSWGEICTFLDKSIPKVPFPSDIGETSIETRFQTTLINDLKRRWFFLVLYFGTLIGLIIYLIYFYEG